MEKKNGFLSYHLEHGKILDIRYVKVVKWGVWSHCYDSC